MNQADPNRQLDSLFHTWAGDVRRAHERAQTEHERRARQGDTSLERTLEVLATVIDRLGLDADAQLRGAPSLVLDQFTLQPQPKTERIS